jgi:hypothetical protein
MGCARNRKQGGIVKLAAQVLPGDFRRSPLAVVGFVILFIVAAYEASSFVIAGDMAGLAFVAMALVGCAFVVVILNNWRNGLYFFLAWLLFEDFARKFLGNNMAIYFAKDFLVLVVYLSFFAAYRRREVATFRPPFLVWQIGVQIWKAASFLRCVFLQRAPTPGKSQSDAEL